MLFVTLYRVFKSMEPLSFDSPAEIDVVRRFLTYPKIFVSSPAWNQTRYLPHGKRRRSLVDSLPGRTQMPLLTFRIF